MNSQSRIFRLLLVDIAGLSGALLLESWCTLQDFEVALAPKLASALLRPLACFRPFSCLSLLSLLSFSSLLAAREVLVVLWRVHQVGLSHIQTYKACMRDCSYKLGRQTKDTVKMA
jgi:hypothetical protein